MRNQTHLIVMCGIPGSGKTTYSKALAQDRDLTRYNHDELPGAFEIKKMHEVYQKMISDVISDLKAGRNVVMEAMFTVKSRRRELLSSISGVDCHKTILVLNTPLDECLRRNATRTGNARMPDILIHSLFDSFETPTLDEGWDEIIYI